MTEGTAAGWHPDPHGRHQHRYFDGTAWTDHVANNGVVTQESAAATSNVTWNPVIRSTRLHMGNRAVSGEVEDQEARVYRKEPGSGLLLEPKSPDEPRWREFHCKWKFQDGRNKDSTIAFPEQFLVTAARLLLIVRSRTDKKGIEHFRVHAVRRTDLPVVGSEVDRRGEVKAVTISDPTGTATLTVSFVSPRDGGFKALLEWLDPVSVSKLDQAAANAARAKRQAEQQAAEERRAAVVAEAARQSLEDARRRFAGVTANYERQAASIFGGNVFDHRKVFYYRVSAHAPQCVDAFETAFGSGGGLVMRAKWEIKKAADSAVAVYGGRKGLAGLTTALSQTANSDQEGALGSTIRFEITAQDGPHCYCKMWLDEAANTLLFINDGRFFRPYMRAVADQLAKVDPSLIVVKE